MATIKFNNGYEITAELNGSTYITSEKPNFPSDLTNIQIDDTNRVFVIPHGRIIECASGGNPGYWFGIVEIPQEEIQQEQIRADVDYLLLISE